MMGDVKFKIAQVIDHQLRLSPNARNENCTNYY
jgi:hypothetical protein